MLQQAAKDGRSEAEVSLDLNRTQSTVSLNEYGVQLETGERLPYESIDEVAETENACFLIKDGEIHKAQLFSAEFQRVYSLYPTRRAPTMLLSGIPMHRIKDTNPHQDTINKIKAIAPVKGNVLDTTTGLGYTAIEAAKTARHVTTIEIDPMAQEIARLNPWSQALFNNPKITQVIGDAFDEIKGFDAGSFSAIIHDPPMFSLAGDLYSLEFYQQAFRMLKHNGRIFHYIGDPESKTGARVTKGVLRRLQEAGFTRVMRAPRAFGVVAYKE